jgi:hypothetical protein
MSFNKQLDTNTNTKMSNNYDKSTYSFNLINNSTELLIEYIDYNFNVYKCLINSSDIFLENYLRNDIHKLKTMLENNTPSFQVKIRECIMTIETPIFIQYELQLVQQNKTNDTGKINILINEINKMKKENEQLHDYIKNEHQQIKTELNNQTNNIINNCVIFGSFTQSTNNNIYNTHCNSVNLNYSMSMAIFDLSPLTILKNLIIINLDIGQKPSIIDTNEEIYKPIEHCKKLKTFNLTNKMIHCDSQWILKAMSNNSINNYTIYLHSLNFLQNLNELTNISIHNVHELNDIDSIYLLPSLKMIDFHFYMNVVLKPNFKTNLKISASTNYVSAK